MGKKTLGAHPRACLGLGVGRKEWPPLREHRVGEGASGSGSRDAPRGSGAGHALTRVLVVEGVHAREVDGERLEGSGQAEAALRALHARTGAGRLGRGGGGGRLGQLGRPILDAEYGARRGGGGPRAGRGSAAGLAGAAGPESGPGAGGPRTRGALCSRRRR